MDKKTNWQEYQAIIEQQGITKLYHFTDRDNLQSIIQNGGLYSWRIVKRKESPLQNLVAAIVHVRSTLVMDYNAMYV